MNEIETHIAELREMLDFAIRVHDRLEQAKKAGAARIIARQVAALRAAIALMEREKT